MHIYVSIEIHVNHMLKVQHGPKDKVQIKHPSSYTFIHSNIPALKADIYWYGLVWHMNLCEVM